VKARGNSRRKSRIEVEEKKRKKESDGEEE
jgi:hypothetical protein